MDVLCGVDFLVLHHTERSIDWPAFVRLRHRMRGWEDIGYHFVIGNGLFAQPGTLIVGRPEEYMGAHAHGYNRNSLGICLIGNFDRSIPDPAQWKAAIDLLAQKSVEYDVDLDHVIGHREIPGAGKSCPGFRIDLDIMRQQVSEAQALYRMPEAIGFR